MLCSHALGIVCDRCTSATSYELRERQAARVRDLQSAFERLSAAHRDLALYCLPTPPAQRSLRARVAALLVRLAHWLSP